MIFNRWRTSVARLIHRQLHISARISTPSLFTVYLPVWTNYQNCWYWLVWGLSFTKIWLYHQKFSLLDKTTFNLNILFSSPSSLVDAMTSLINIAYDQCWLAKHLSRPPRKLLYTVFRKTCDHVFYVRLQRFLAQLLLGHWQVFFLVSHLI